MDGLVPQAAVVVPDVPAMDEATATVWTPKMQKELAFQTNKRRKRFIEARASGTSPDDKWTPADEADLHETVKQERSTMRRREREESNRSVAHPTILPIAAGSHVHFTPGAEPDAAMHAALRRNSLVFEADRNVASVFVVPRFDALGQRCTWLAALYGGLIVTPIFIHSAAASGPCVRHRPAIHTRRRIWVSPLFMAQHDVLCAILHVAVAKSGRKWKWFEGDADAFATCRSTPAPIGLVVKSERKNAAPHCLRFVLSEALLLSPVCTCAVQAIH